MGEETSSIYASSQPGSTVHPVAVGTERNFPRSKSTAPPDTTLGRPARPLDKLRHPKGTDLGVHSSHDLDWVAQELNDQPRKRLAFKKLIELIGDLLLR